MQPPESHNPHNPESYRSTDINNQRLNGFGRPVEGLLSDIGGEFHDDLGAEGEPREPGIGGLEELAKEPDYIDKVSMVPLQINTLQGVLDQMAADPRYSSAGDTKQDLYGSQLLAEMKSALNKLSESAKPGDCVTFDDLLFEAERVTGHIERMSTESVTDQASLSEFSPVAVVTDTFATYFDRQTELRAMGDDIDKYTIHPDVHGQVKSYLKADKNADLHGMRYGDGGRWIPQKRGNRTVWVSREQVTREQQDDDVAAAQKAVDKAFADITGKSAGSEGLDPEIILPGGREPEKARVDDLSDSVPDDLKERVVFARNTFGGDYDPSKEPLFVAFLQKQLQGVVDGMPEGVTYPDTVAAVVGNGGDAWNYLSVALAMRAGRQLTVQEVSKMPFSDAARILGINVEQVIPDYSNRFSTRNRSLRP